MNHIDIEKELKTEVASLQESLQKANHMSFFQEALSPELLTMIHEYLEILFKTDVALQYHDHKKLFELKGMLEVLHKKEKFLQYKEKLEITENKKILAKKEENKHFFQLHALLELQHEAQEHFILEHILEISREIIQHIELILHEDYQFEEDDFLADEKTLYVQDRKEPRPRMELKKTLYPHAHGHSHLDSE